MKTDPLREHRMRALAARLQANAARLPPDTTLEHFVESPGLGSLPISRAQRALCRAADGLAVTHLDSASTHFHFGVDAMPAHNRPRVVFVRTGVRAAKSLIAALALVLRALTCTMRRPPLAHERGDERDGLVGVRPGELVRALIVAPMLRLSRAPFFHVMGALKASETLSKYVVKWGAESITLKRDDGAEVLVEMVAASRGGANLRSTWLAGVVFDEADFHDEDDAAVNLKENFQAVATRVLPGGQVWVVSSPWDDSGEFHELFTGSWGQPGRAVAFHSDSQSMNPTLDPADIEAERRRDPENAAREYDAVPLASGSLAFFPKAAVDVAMASGRTTSLPPNDAPHWGGSDLGLRKNSSALGIARRAGPKVALAYWEELIPAKGAHLKPGEACRSFARTALSYRCLSIMGDSHYADTAHEEFPKVRAEWDGRVACSYQEWQPSAAAQAEAFSRFRTMMLEGQLDLPADPRLRKQIEDTKFKKGPNGIQVVLPKHGAAHGDLLMAVVLACVQVPEHIGTVVGTTLSDIGSRYGDGDGRWF